MKAIWKYKLEALDEQDIEMPANARILYVGSQNGDMFIWVEVNVETTEMELRKIYMHATGQNYMGHRRYIGTVQMYNGELIFHVFE